MICLKVGKITPVGQAYLSIGKGRICEMHVKAELLPMRFGVVIHILFFKTIYPYNYFFQTVHFICALPL